MDNKDNKFETRYRFTVSVFFERIGKARPYDWYYSYRCKECSRIFENAKFAKAHFNRSHEDMLARCADLGFIERYFIKLSTGTHMSHTVDVIRRHKEQILRKIDREDLLEVLK
jgi:DNA-directed RNA polymerase subunit RPC12/RpoP